MRFSLCSLVSSLPSSLQVLPLLEVFPHGSNVVLTLEYMSCDLSSIISCFSTIGMKVPERMVKIILWNILQGVAAVHEEMIMHRVRKGKTTNRSYTIVIDQLNKSHSIFI